MMQEGQHLREIAAEKHMHTSPCSPSHQGHAQERYACWPCRTGLQAGHNTFD
jgi:hypothetical protein